MELSRFHSVVKEIATDYKVTAIDSNLTSLIANLASLGANPGNPSVSQGFKDQLNTFRTSLSQSELNSADGELQTTINNFGLLKYVGNGLFDAIKKVLDENQLTPNLASAEIEKIRAEAIKTLGVIVALDNALSELGVEYSVLNTGQTEMLISLPMEQESKTLEDLAKESKDWHQISRAVAETFDADQSRVTIRTIESGSILLYLAATATFIYGMAKCLKGVNQILAEVIKMKGLYNQLVESKVPESILTDYEKHHEGKAKLDLTQLASTLVDENYQGGDVNRKNELKNSLSISLQRLSQKLATGTTVNLRLANPRRPKISEGVEPTPEEKAAIEKVESFEKAKIEVDASKAALDYREHAIELIAALPAPGQDTAEDAGSQ